MANNGQITVSGPVAITGAITNSSTGLATTHTISGVIGANVNSLCQNSANVVLSLSGQNQFTCTPVISAGKIKLGAQKALYKAPYNTTGMGATVGLDATGQTTPWLGGLSGNVDLSTAITAYSSVTALTLNPQTGTSVTYGGVIASGSGATTLTKEGPGSQTLTGANTYSGATTLENGTLALGGAAGTALNSAFTVRGGTLVLDNSAGWANRLADATALSLGSLSLISSNGAGVRAETNGATTFATAGRVAITNGTTGGDQTTLVLGAVTRSAGAAIDFVGANGTLGSGANSPNVTSTGSWPSPSGGAGTWILPYATVNGTQWAEDNANSIRAYSGALPALAGATSAQNARETAGSSLGGAATANSLNIASSGSGTQTLALGAYNLTLGSGAATPGAILKSGTDAWIISGSSGQVRAGSGGAGTELITHVDGGDLTISAPLNTAIVGIAKGGTGKLILSGTRATTMNGASSIAGGQLEFQGLTTTFSGVLSGPGGVTVNLTPGQVMTLSGANTYSGPSVVQSGYAKLATGLSPRSNLQISNVGIAEVPAFTRTIGPGPDQIQVTGSTCGFTGNTGGTVVNFGGTVVVWGSTYFNPTVLVLGDPLTGPNSSLVFNNLNDRIDLNGADRTIQDNKPISATAGWNNSLAYSIATTPYIINTTGTAGLIKTGTGELYVGGANTYNGATTINGGILTANVLANGGVASSIGLSSSAAANLVLASGATLKYAPNSGAGGGATSSDRSFTLNGTANGDFFTLDASGSGALNLTSTATPGYGTTAQTRTLILTGTSTYTNTLAANLTDNGGAAVSVAKTGAGTWVLSGANAYTGPTTLNAGTLLASSANALPGYNVAGKVVLNSGTLQVTMDGSAWTEAQVNTLVANATKVTGALVLDVSGTQTQSGAYNLGVFGLAKAGTGTLVINQPNTYVGATTISGGVLQYDNGATIPTTPLLNNGALIVNRTDTLTQGTNFHSIMIGAGSLTNIGSGTLALNNINTYSGITKAAAGTIALSHPLALWNSAIDTTGSGVFTLSGVTNLTLGGLSGASGNLGTGGVLDTGYSSVVTNLTLNPSGTVTYGGTIGNGASGMSLTMAGSGTQVLQGANTYSGSTILKAGTLTLSGASGSIANTSGLSLSGGTLNLVNASGANSADRVPSATITSASGGTIQFNNTAAAVNYAETLGSITLSGGQLNVYSVNRNNTSQTQILTLGGTLANSTTATITFSGASLGADNRNQINVSGQATTSANQIIGPWALYGSAPGALTDYVVYNITGGIGNSLGIQPAAITATTQGSWTTPGNAYTVNTTETLSTTRTIAALRNTLAAGSVTLATGANLETYGILNGAAALTVAQGTGGVLTTPSGGGNLFLTAGAGSIAVSAPINNSSDSQPVTLVKSGSGALTLSSITSTYSGGTVLNAGSLTTTADSNLGNGGGITVNGAVAWNWTSGTYGRAVTINEGAVLTVSANGTDTGLLSGNGTIAVSGAFGPSFNNTGSTFAGTVNAGYAISIAGLGDSSNPIILGNFIWTGGAKTFALRPFISSTASGYGYAIYNNGTGALVVQQPLIITGTAGARPLTLGGTYTASANTFAGNITDGPGSVVSLTKAAGGMIWALCGTNTYSGATTPSANTSPGALIFQGMQALSPLTWLISGNIPSDGGRIPATITILDDSATPASRSSVNLYMSNGNGQEAMTVFVGNNSAANGGNGAGGTQGSTIQLGNMNFSQASGAGLAGNNLAVTGANGYKLQLNNVTVTLQSSAAGYWNAKLNPTTASLTVAGNVQQTAGALSANTTLQLDGTATNNLISGNIMNSADGSPKALTLTKQNTSEWILSGTNTYTGITKISGGTLQAVPGIGLPSTSYLQLDGGVLQASGNFTRVNSTTVNGANMQWLSANGGGFSARGGKLTVAINNSASTEQVWGTAVGNNVIWGTLKFGSATANSEVEFQNNIDLAGTTRTVDVASGTGGDFATLSGVIRTASGTVGLTKTGTGTLLLSGANTYNGVTTISAGGGTLAVSSIANVASPNPLGQSSAAAANLLLGNNTTLKYTGPTASTDRSFTINGTAAGHQAALDASGTGAITFATTNSPAYGTTAQTRLLILTGSNTDNNTLAANLPNNGTGALSIQKSGTGTWVISGSNTYSGTTTVDLGTLRLGGRNALSANTTVVIGAGTLDMAGYTNTVGTLNVTGAGTINLGAGGKLAFANSSANAWSGGSLRITGNFVSGASIRFGNSSGGLTAAQLAALSSPGISSFVIDANGYLVAIRPTIITFR